MHRQVISLNGCDLHYVAYVQSTHPLRLIQEPKDVPHVQEFQNASPVFAIVSATARRPMLQFLLRKLIIARWLLFGLLVDFNGSVPVGVYPFEV